LLRTGMPGLEFEVAKRPRSSISAPSRTAATRKTQAGRGPAATRSAQRTAKPSMAAARAGSDGGMKRVDMIAAALKRHPRLTVRELIAALDRQFGWKCGESNLTAHLYTNPERFSHSKADRAGKQLVTWSLR